jgi:hypothetical protein
MDSNERGRDAIVAAQERRPVTPTSRPVGGPSAARRDAVLQGARWVRPVLENVVPLAGVLILGWSILPIVVYYWLDALVVGGLAALAAWRAHADLDAWNDTEPDPARPSSSWPVIRLRPFLNWAAMSVMTALIAWSFAVGGRQGVEFQQVAAEQGLRPWLVVASAVYLLAIYVPRYRRTLVRSGRDRAGLAHALALAYRRRWIVFMPLAALMSGGLISFLYIDNWLMVAAAMIVATRIIYDLRHPIRQAVEAQLDSQR